MREALRRYGKWVLPLMIWLYFTRNAYGACLAVGGGSRCFGWDVDLVGGIAAALAMGVFYWKEWRGSW
jgi:hypothetical protein